MRWKNSLTEKRHQQFNQERKIAWAKNQHRSISNLENEMEQLTEEDFFSLIPAPRLLDDPTWCPDALIHCKQGFYLGYTWKDIWDHDPRYVMNYCQQYPDQKYIRELKKSIKSK